jgi:hypothetical protein
MVEVTRKHAEKLLDNRDITTKDIFEIETKKVNVLNDLG